MRWLSETRAGSRARAGRGFAYAYADACARAGTDAGHAAATAGRRRVLGQVPRAAAGRARRDRSTRLGHRQAHAGKHPRGVQRHLAPARQRRAARELDGTSPSRSESARRRPHLRAGDVEAERRSAPRPPRLRCAARRRHPQGRRRHQAVRDDDPARLQARRRRARRQEARAPQGDQRRVDQARRGVREERRRGHALRRGERRRAARRPAAGLDRGAQARRQRHDQDLDRLPRLHPGDQLRGRR